MGRMEQNVPRDFDGLLNAIDGVCRAKGIPDPARWLASIMAGRDPRPMETPLVEMMRKIVFRQFDDPPGDPMPTEDEWQAMVDHVLGSGLYDRAPVDLRASQAAATKLMDHLHSKRQEIRADISGVVGPREAIPLTTDEIHAFREMFDDVF
jgi:hypothetical protein